MLTVVFTSATRPVTFWHTVKYLDRACAVTMPVTSIDGFIRESNLPIPCSVLLGAESRTVVTPVYCIRPLTKGTCQARKEEITQGLERCSLELLVRLWVFVPAWVISPCMESNS